MKEEKPKLETLEGRVTFLETRDRLREQLLSKEEIEAKINELTKQRQALENELQQIAEEEQPKRDEIWQKIDLINAELQAYEQALAAQIAGLTQPSGSAEEGKAKEAEWDTEYINGLPDSAFAYIEPGGEKDEQEKTTPRSLRHFPFKNAEGNLSKDHIVNGLARLGQDLGDWATDDAKAQIKKKLCGAVEAWNREHEDKIESDVCGTATEQQGNQEPEKDEHGCVVGKERWDPDQEKCVPIATEQQGNQEPEKDEHGCIIGKERYDEEQDKCVPIATEKAVEIVTKMLEATEQAEDMTVEEIKQKIVDLAKQKEELDNKLWPEAPAPSPLSDEERVTIQAQIDVLYAEIEAYEQALAIKIAGQAAEKKGLGEAIIDPNAPQQPSLVVPVEKLEAALPPLQAERSMSYGSQRFVQDVKKLIREAKEESESG